MKRDIEITNTALEKRQLRGSVPNFKALTLAVQKVQGKETCENVHVETANFMYNFVRKSNATEQLWWHFIFFSKQVPRSWITSTRLQAFYTNFSISHVFNLKIRWRLKFKNRPKASFVKSSISSLMVQFLVLLNLIQYPLDWSFWPFLTSFASILHQR